MARPANNCCRLFLLVLAAAGSIAAGDLQFWNQTDIRVLERGRLFWSVLGGFRLRSRLTDSYDHRVGTQVRINLHRRARLSAGYLHRWLDPDGRGAYQHERLYFAPTFVAAMQPLLVEPSVSIERQIGVPGRPDYNRYRPRLEVEWLRKRVSPFISQEFLFQREGFLRSRSIAGLRWRLESGLSLEAGYLFDSLKTAGHWLPRHAIATRITLGPLVPHT